MGTGIVPSAPCVLLTDPRLSCVGAGLTQGVIASPTKGLAKQANVRRDRGEGRGWEFADLQQDRAVSRLF